MKIFNLQPITVKEYIFNQEHLAESQSSCNLEVGFQFDCKVVNSLKAMIITFEILYTVGGVVSNQEMSIFNNTNELLVMGTNVYEEGAGEILMYYKSSCEFNLENEGFETDVLSMCNFLSEYNTHTQKFLNQYKPESFQIEKDIFMHPIVQSNAITAIENLKGNNMYEF